MPYQLQNVFKMFEFIKIFCVSKSVSTFFYFYSFGGIVSSTALAQTAQLTWQRFWNAQEREAANSSFSPIFNFYGLPWLLKSPRLLFTETV